MDDERPAGDLHAAQASPTRRHLLALLRNGEAPQDAHGLAAATSLHVSTVRFHLQILERAGLVSGRPHPRGSSGRPRTVYTATAVPDPAIGPSPYEQMARLLAAHLDDTAAGRSARAEHAGTVWAAQLIPIDDPSTAGSGITLDAAAGEVNSVFADVGFDPELTSTRGHQRIALHACPFRAVAREHPDVVCAMHLGLMRGVLTRVGAPPTATQLMPFVEPELCVAHLSPLG